MTNSKGEEESVPIIWAYNHHFEAYITGAQGEVRLQEAHKNALKTSSQNNIPICAKFGENNLCGSFACHEITFEKLLLRNLSYEMRTLPKTKFL
jgi:hypothetical protein